MSTPLGIFKLVRWQLILIREAQHCSGERAVFGHSDITAVLEMAEAVMLDSASASQSDFGKVGN